MSKHEFKDNHRELIVELIRWYWNNYPKVIWMGVDNSDYEFLYSLWKNTVSKYDDKMRSRLNRIRDIYVKHK